MYVRYWLLLVWGGDAGADGDGVADCIRVGGGGGCVRCPPSICPSAPTTDADFGGLFLVITGFFSFVKNFFTLEPISALIHVSLKSQFLELSGYFLPAVLLGCR